MFSFTSNITWLQDECYEILSLPNPSQKYLDTAMYSLLRSNRSELSQSSEQKEEMLYCIEDGWANLKEGPSAVSEGKPSGLVIYIMDITASMAPIKESLATSSFKVMRAIHPGVDYASDFDSVSCIEGPILEAPNTEGWVTGDQFSEYLLL
nr:MAG: wsv465-like protein [Metapenaeus ensis nimavirus]